MNRYFIEDLSSAFEEVSFDIGVYRQDEISGILESEGLCDKFPMICYEYTEESDFECDMSESKFLNDSVHEGTWIVGYGEYGIMFVMCIKDRKRMLDINVLEVNMDERGNGVGTLVAKTVEDVACSYYDSLWVSPYDSNAEKFWKKMGFSDSMYGFLIKKIDGRHL